MKYNAMKKWVKALRSGRFKQGRAKLATYEIDDVTGDNIGDELSFCCLGVLCEINDVPFRIGDDELLGDDALERLGFKTLNGKLPKSYKTKNGEVNDLAALNDMGLSFKQIANIIEKNYKHL
jgi:hypothetical protein